jgi:hypothetical protein
MEKREREGERGRERENKDSVPSSPFQVPSSNI